MLSRHQAGLDERFLRRRDFRNQYDFFAIEHWFVLVALAVMRREKIRGDLFCQIKRSVKCLARMLGETGPGRQRLGIEQLIQHKRKITAREKFGGHKVCAVMGVGGTARHLALPCAATAGTSACLRLPAAAYFFFRVSSSFWLTMNSRDKLALGQRTARPIRTIGSVNAALVVINTAPLPP